MLLIHNKYGAANMNQTQDTGLSQEGYLERLLQEQHQQYQQKVQQQLSGKRNVNDSNDNVDITINSNEKFFVGRPSGNSSFSSRSNGTSPSPAMAISNSIGIGINHQQQQQQSRMINYLQERQQQQQQQFMTGNIMNGPSDISSNLGIASLSSNIGLDSRLGGNGIGSGISANAWMDAFNRGGLGHGAIANTGASLYSSDQDLLMNAQRYQLAGNTIGTNRLTINEGNGSITDNPLTSLLGGLPQFCVPQQSLSAAQNSLNEAQKSNQKSFTDLILAKQAQAALLQAAQARLPRTIRLPCGARGMKADHNSSVSISQRGSTYLCVGEWYILYSNHLFYSNNDDFCRRPISTFPKTHDTVNIYYARIRSAGRLGSSLGTVSIARSQLRNKIFALVICMLTSIPTTKRKMKKKLVKRKITMRTKLNERKIVTAKRGS